MSDIYKVVYSKVIKQAIKDLIGAAPTEKEDAIRYLHSDAFLDHCVIAEYLRGLQDALDEMMLMSKPERSVVAKMLMEELDS